MVSWWVDIGSYKCALQPNSVYICLKSHVYPRYGPVPYIYIIDHSSQIESNYTELPEIVVFLKILLVLMFLLLNVKLET